jgi:ubiquinone/menaquinone biosynthesis C-methylase UbiE
MSAENINPFRAEVVDDIRVSDLEIMAKEAQNYRAWMFRKVEPFIGQRVLEIGAGIGNFTDLLTNRELVVATDVFPECVEKLNQRLGRQLRVPPMLLDICAAEALELRRHRFDTIVCLNVLEHIENDCAALSNMQAVLSPGGRLVLVVPALQWIYGTVDESLLHYRRYTKGSLRPRMERAGFRIEALSYMNVVGVAGWFLNNRILKRRTENANQIAIFDRWIAPWAERLERIVPLPIGLSLVAIGRKP